MDLNGDGQQDIITGHYWPGDIFVFYGEGDGKFDRMNHLKDESGRNLNAGPPWKSEQDYQLASLAAAPFAADMDGDGDFDMLIGNIKGNVIRIENIGTAKEPLFSTKRSSFTAGGKEISVPGGDAGPVYADWNHDGVRDLVVGAGDGSVWFYQNTVKDSAPEFAAGRKIVPEGSWDAYPHGTVPKHTGVRSKVCVADYNGDGLVDLLLGDYISEKPAPLDLTDEQIQRRDELRKRKRDVLSKLSDIESEEERAKIFEEYREIRAELSQYEARNISHGFVWLFLRNPAKTAQAAQ